MHVLFEPGFFSSGPVQTAAVIGALTAIVSAVVGVFTVVRSQSFAGHALTDVATTGGSGAFLLGLSPLTGFIAGGVIGGGAMEMIGVERARSRDVATGIVLGAATGLSALFLYLDATRSATTGATQQILFGSIFTIDPSIVPAIVILSAATLLVLGVISPTAVAQLGQCGTRRRPGASACASSACCSCWLWPSPSACRRSPSDPFSRRHCSSDRRPRPCASPGACARPW